MATSCSNWWQCPIYFAMSITLAVIAISTSIHSTPNNPTPSNQTFTHILSLNASRALRKQGFNAIATLLQINPDLFLSTPKSTIFALQDPWISTVSAHPNAMKKLLKYHISPSNLPLKELFKKPQNTCLQTLVHHKKMVITKIDPKKGLIEINNVLISHPDLFLDGPISIHGVLSAFSPLNPQNFDRDWEISQPPICNANTHYRKISNTSESKNAIEWNRVIRFLSSNGFVSFGIRLHSVLDGIVKDNPDLDSVTVFAPLDFLFVIPAGTLMDRVVKFHIVPQRITYAELASLPEEALLRTLVPERSLVVNKSAYSKGLMAVNGVEIVAPDSFSSDQFVIHGVSRAFGMDELPSF